VSGLQPGDLSIVARDLRKTITGGLEIALEPVRVADFTGTEEDALILAPYALSGLSERLDEGPFDIDAAASKIL